MHGAVEGPFAKEVPFHREKASPALLASIGELTIFIMITCHAVQSVLQRMGLLQEERPIVGADRQTLLIRFIFYLISCASAC